MMDPSKLKVVELRAALSERGLDTKGNKPVLVERLRKALEEETLEYGSVLHTEDIGDTALKDTQERVTEATRSSQPPRTPSRASRSSSMTTPTKISTRNAAKASTTPNSSKQSTPSKPQYGERPYETLMTISESVSEEPVQEEMSKMSPEKYREEQEDDTLNIVQNKVYSSVSEKYETEEAKHVNILEGNKYQANILQVPATEPSEKSSTIACIDQFSISREGHEAKISSIGEDDKIQQLATETEDKKLEEKIEMKDDNIDKIQDAFEKSSPEKLEKENECIEDRYNIKDNIDIPEVEQPTHVIPDQVDKTCDTELKHGEKTIHDDYTVQDKMDISMKIENLDEKDDNEVLQDKQEMTEDYFSKEKVALDTKESNRMECNDRKRKRSPSPTEIRQVSPVPQKAEDEPDLDESVVILSWYDSDLNLVINKDGFFSATPMREGDLCDMWAGARASHGFLNGKVYYEVRITQQYPTVTKDEKHSHVLRIGWSVPSTSMQLGEEKLSYAYTSAGQQGTDRKFTDYGSPFDKDDVVGCYLDMTPENTVELFYTVNGKNVGTAFSVPKEELGDKPLFPHILSKNCTFACNFGQEKAWCEQIPDYIFVGNVELKDKIAGPRRPNEKADCEVIMMCGLPAAGKTTWAMKHAADHPDKLYNILALHNLVEKTGDIALSDQEQNICQRETVIDRCSRALDQLIDVASGRRRNYILDQKSNIYSSAQRRKMRNFCGYQRKAIVVIPTDEDYNQRLSTHNAIEENVSESKLTEMKANFTAPSVGEYFDAVEWIGLDEEEAKKLIEKYNKEGKDAGFNQQSTAKRPRIDKTESNKEARDSRNRDNRDRRNNYQDRGRHPWRGANMGGGWRGERPQRGGYMRHTGGYGHPVPWRLRGRGGPAMVRGSDRRMPDRRAGNDRNRSIVPRQGGGWGPMSANYQGSQQPSWGQQDNWSSSQAQGSWSQQSGWGQQQWGGGWKGYGQGTYSQTGYNQHGYGNGNWNSWNQQYYNNQYWGQQQQSGQTTAASGQAEITSEMVAPTSTNTGAGYNYSQG